MMKVDGLSYHEAVSALLTRGNSRAPRGKPCRSLFNVTVRSDCQNQVPQGIGFDLDLAIAELMAIVCGWDDAAFFEPFTKNLQQFAEDDGRFHGSYGRRLESQWEPVLDRLSRDRDTRQAVMAIWDQTEDLVDGFKDYPCNVTLQWYILDGKLNLTVMQRSCDIVWGLPYDNFVFTGVLQLLANTLRLTPGEVVRNVTDLHIYESNVFYPASKIERCMISKRWTTWSTSLTFSQFLERSIAIRESGQYNLKEQLCG